jgi:hypothetical protein
MKICNAIGWEHGVVYVIMFDITICVITKQSFVNGTQPDVAISIFLNASNVF